jgi:hypothetical protein
MGKTAKFGSFKTEKITVGSHVVKRDEAIAYAKDHRKERLPMARGGSPL